MTKVAIAGAGRKGGLSVRVHLADFDQPANCCRVQFGSGYPALASFRAEIEAMLERRIGCAVLRGGAA